MAQQVGVLEIMLMANMAKLSQDMNAATKVVGDATGQMERHIASAKNAMSGLGMGVGLAVMTDQLRRATDTYVKLDAQVRINTKSQEQYNQALGDIRRISTTAQADIAATSMLYTRLKATMDGTGTSLKQIATVTETVTYGLKAYGATSAEAASAALQLSQAMGSGRLGGEEFRAVMEAMPNVMQVLADSMRVPLGRLRELSIAGEITAEEMMKAFGNEKVAERFRQLAMESLTITGAFQVLRNEFTLYVGDVGKTSGVTQGITQSIMFLAENLKILGQAVLFSAAVMVGKFVGGIMASVKAYGVLAIAQEAAIAQNIALAKTKVADVAATQAAIIADRERTISIMQTTTATVAHNAAVKDLALLGAAQAATVKNMTIAQKELAAAQTLSTAAAVTWGTSVPAAIRAVGIAISTFIVAHPLIALATAIIAVVTAIANWESVTKGAKATFEWMKEAVNAIHFAVGAFGISIGATTQKLALMSENWRALISRDSADRGAFDAKIKALDDLATAQKQALANEISGYTASLAAAAETEEKRKKLNQKALDEFMGSHLTRQEQRTKEVAEATKQFLLLAKETEIGGKTHLALVEKFHRIVADIDEKYGKDRVKAAKKVNDDLRKAEQERMENMLDDDLKYIRARIKAEDARTKSANATAEARIAEEESLKKKIDAAEWELLIIGKTKEAVELLKTERDGESISHLEKLKESGVLDEAELAHIQKKIDLLNELKGVREKASAAQAELAAQKEIERAEKDRWKMVDNIAHDTFMNITNKGKNAFKEIGASIKTYLLEMLYKMTAQKFLINVGLSGLSGMTAGAAQAAAGGGGGIVDLMSIGSTISTLPSIGTAVSNLGTIIPTFTTMLETGATVMESASAAFAGTASSFAAVAPWAVGAAVIADAVGLFGKGGGPQQGQYGVISAKGYVSSETMSGGDVLGNQALAASIYAQVAAIASAAGKASAEITIGQGYKLDPQGTSAGSAYRNLIVNGRNLSSGTGGTNGNPGITFGNADATAAANFLGRLNTRELQALIEELNDPKLTEASNALMATFGELENSLPSYLTAQAMQKTAMAALMTESEKTEQATKDMAAGFEALGDEVPTSVAALKDLVSGIDLTTSAGQTHLAGIYKLIPAFMQLSASVKDVADNSVATAKALEIAKQQRKLDIELMDAQGDSSGAIAAARSDELAEMDASLRATKALIWALRDESSAKQVAVRDAELAAASLMSMRGSLVASSRIVVDAYKSAYAAAEAMSKDAESAVVASRDALTSAYRREADALRATIDKFKGFSRTLLEFRNSLMVGGQSSLNPGQKYAEAESQLNKLYLMALAGDPESVQKLTSAASTFLDLSKSQSRTSTEYARDVAKVQRMIEASASAAIDQSGIAESSLVELQSSVAGLIAINESVISVREAIIALNIANTTASATKAAAAQAEAKVAAATEQWTMPNAAGMRTWTSGAGAVGIQSAAEAMDGSGTIVGIQGEAASFDEAKAFVNAANASGDIMSIYTTAKQWGVGMQSLDELMGWSIGTSADWARSQGLPTFAQGIDNVPYDMTADIHAGERIFPAADNRELMARLRDPQISGEAVVAELRAVRAELAASRIELQEIKLTNRRMDRTTLKWDGEGLPEVRAGV